jgi:DNA-binding helix-hairpin-helix protein with protein kinase domain
MVERVDSYTKHHKHTNIQQTSRLAAFLRVGVQLAEALARLHEAGLSHGDVRPPNVLLERRSL